MPAFLFYREPNAMGRDFAYLDRLLNMFGFTPIVIDPEAEETHYGAHFYPSLTDAVTDPRWADHTWIWLDPNGSMRLDDITPPPNGNVIYCVGSDKNGFGGKNHPGIRVRLSPEMAAETFATLVIPAVCGFHRWRR
jgi:hypothetical protein